MNMDRFRLMIGVWLGVYPAVLVISYLLQPLEWPLYLSTFVSTLITVPLITYIVVPLCFDAIAAMDHRPKEDIDA